MLRTIIGVLGPTASILIASTAVAAPSRDVSLIDRVSALIDAAPSGPPVEDRFGFTVASGDFNGDGLRDIAVGAPRIDKVFVHLGDLSGSLYSFADIDAVYEGTAGAETGWSLAMGDLDDDGRDELIVGEPSLVDSNGVVTVLRWPFASGETPSAMVELHNEPNTRLVSFVGPKTRSPAYAGWSVASGDFDGDGLRDVLIGACEASDDDPEVGDTRVRGRPLGVVYMMSQADMQYGTSMRLENATASYWGMGNTGCSVASAGDFDGDGIEDMLFGSHGLTYRREVTSGAATIVFGSPSLPRVTRLVNYQADGNLALISHPGIATVIGERKGGNLGRSVASAGDVNGDGRSDVILGAPAIDCPNCRSFPGDGRAYLLLGGVGLRGGSLISDVAAAEFTTHSTAWVGVDVASAGDVDGDGADDFLIGSDKNAAYLFRGEYTPSASIKYECEPGVVTTWSCAYPTSGVPPMPGISGSFNVGSAYRVFHGDDPNEYAGMTVEGVGDVTGDGDVDVVIAAPYQRDYYTTHNHNGFLYLLDRPAL